MSSLIRIQGLAELHSYAERLIERFSGPQLVLLCGEMGAGKTELTRAIVKTLGGAAAASPTFAIHHQYQTPQQTVDHYDLYRMEKEEDLETSGLQDRLMQPAGWVVVEWANRLDDSYWPRTWNVLKLTMKRIDSNTREIKESILNQI